MADIAIFRINYKSDFILTLNCDAGWATPFCIKFWTGAPSQAYFAGYDGTTYTHCAPVEGEPTKLTVQFDDHHLPIGDLKFQIGYHFTVADFPTTVEDEVLNQASVIIEQDGEPAQVMLDFNGETAPEIEFSLPAYANEAQRIANEQQRIENEQARISAENERISNEDARIAEEQVRVSQEAARVSEFAELKADAQEATADANAAAELANEKAAEAQQKATYAQTQGDYAKAQGDIAQADHTRAESDHTTATADHTQAAADHTRADSDHTTATADHTQAAADHTRADSDHTRAESDHEAVELYVDSLGAFDISAYHATGGVLAKYADLAAALGTDGANIPYAIRKGGMSVKFVLSSDNKYVQFCCVANEFTTNLAYWQKMNLEEEVSQLGQKLIKLAKWGAAGSPTDLEVGDIYTSNGTNLIRVDEIIDGTITQFTIIPFIDGAIYTYHESLYVYNGTRLVKTVDFDRSKIVYSENFFGNILSEVIIGDETTKIRDFIQNDAYGLKQGYILSDGWNNDNTRVSTKLLDAIVSSIDVKITNNVYAIAGYAVFNSDYTYKEYVNSGFQPQRVILPVGYIYELILKRTSGGNLSPADIAPYIVINDRLRIFELEQNTSIIVDSIIDVASLAETNTWYQGTTIGNAVIKGTFENAYALKYQVAQGESYQLTAKGGSSGRGWYLLDEDDKIVDLATSNFNDTINITIPNGVTYILIQSNDGISHLALTKYGQVSVLSAKVRELVSAVENVETDIDDLKKSVDSFKCLTPFLWNKFSRIKNQESGFCNIGFIGDSWTQGTENIIDGVQSGYAGYVEPLTKLLQDEYGFGGLGWLDFAIDGGSPTSGHKMFGCVDLYKHWTYQFSGTITGLDGHDDQQAANCLGICCAHTIFGNNASLSLTFDANYLDVFKLRYYKNAHFNVSVNGGTPIEVTANADDGWQETTFGTTGTDITSVVITSLADGTIIFGMDCFYGIKGVRCHKIGNRSIEASDYLKMSATQWEAGISLLDLDWCSVLLAINDLGGSTSESKMDTIVTNISNLINRLKVATDDGNGLVTCDINLLGVENIEAAGWTGLGMLAAKQKEFALVNGYGWASTDKCIGATKAEFVHNGTFSDTIHLNIIGSYAYGQHIYNSLFRF